MSVRYLLQFNQHGSHAVTVCEPWTRLLVEVESPGNRGHVIGQTVALRKTTNHVRQISSIEVEQLCPNHAAAERYLIACAWWLHKRPFDVERLPVTLISHVYNGSLLSAPAWRVTKLDLSWTDLFAGMSVVDLQTFDSLLPDLEVLNVFSRSQFSQWQRPVWHTELLTRCRKLRELNLSYATLPDITVIPTQCLVTLDLGCCQRVTDITHLAQASHLSQLVLCETNITDLSPLRHCLALLSVHIEGCRRISDLSPLGRLPCLEALYADETGITDLSPLATCAALRTLSLRYLRRLQDLSVLATGTPLLERIDVSYTGVTDVAPLASCPQLLAVRMDGNASFSDLGPLSACARLEELRMTEVAVSDLTPLASCASLRVLSLPECKRLDSVAPLAGAPALETIDISGSLVADLTPLALCRALREVTVSGCAALTNLAPLACLPHLESINAASSGIRHITGLNACPALATVSFCYCNALYDLSPLAGAPRLARITADSSAVQCLAGLHTCPRLRHVSFKQCKALHSLSPLWCAAAGNNRCDGERCDNADGSERVPVAEKAVH